MRLARVRHYIDDELDGWTYIVVADGVTQKELEADIKEAEKATAQFMKSQKESTDKFTAGEMLVAFLHQMGEPPGRRRYRHLHDLREDEVMEAESELYRADFE